MNEIDIVGQTSGLAAWHDAAHQDDDPVTRAEFDALAARVAALETSSPPPTDPPPTDPPPPLPATLIGYGKGVTGGATEVVVRTLPDARNALKTGNRVVIEGDGVWDLAGKDLTINQPDVSLIVRGRAQLKGGALRIEQGAKNIYVENVRARAGDASGNAQDLDAITVNAQGGQITDLYFKNCEALWAPDVCFVFLGDIQNVTLDRCIIGGGLFRSKHPESGDANGHSMGLNLVDTRFVTVYGSLIALNETRNPQLRRAGPVDIVNCVLALHNEAPYGDAKYGLNIIGCTYVRGVEPFATLGPNARAEKWVFRSVAKDGPPTPNSVYASDVVGIDLQLSGVSDAVRANTVRGTLSVTPLPAGAGYSLVLEQAGATPRDTVTESFLAAARGSGRYYNGVGQPAPNPTWG